MAEAELRLLRLTWRRFLWAVQTLLASDRAQRAITYASLLAVGILLINALNVLNSFVGRDFMSAIQARDFTVFWQKALLYALVFILSTIAATLFRFLEERLGLLWREQLTWHFIDNYLQNRTYLLMGSNGVANPDQRITEDVRAFTTTTLSFLLLIANALITVFSFSGVLLSISPLLFAVAITYAALGSLVTALLGRPLIRLNYAQLDLEANLRSDLIHLRENADSIALGRREGRFRTRLHGRLQDVITNLRRIIAVNRNLSFFTNGYNYFIQLVPVLVIAPMFMRGEVEFGVVTQSMMAFSTLMGAFSLIVTQFQSISAFTAVTTRIHLLSEAMENTVSSTPSQISIEQTDGEVEYLNLTLQSLDCRRTLLRSLNLFLPRSAQLVVTASDELQMLALFRATANLWPCGQGIIRRPGIEDVLFLPERPYWPPGLLRNALLRSGRELTTSDREILAVLDALGLSKTLERVGGLNAERDWNAALSIGEQQLFSIARLTLAKPRIVFLDRPGSSLPLHAISGALDLFRERHISVVLMSTNGETSLAFDFFLDIHPDGSWTTGPHRPEYYLEQPSSLQTPPALEQNL